MAQLDPLVLAALADDGARRVMAALEERNLEARFVGGAVRDALLGRAVDDIDLAVQAPPEQVMAVLAQQGLKVVPTGFAHGTVTAVVGHKGYELTSLRRDMASDGRHATVVFTDDWQADAARRDFTFNALYVDSKGRVYDYFGGREDLAAGRVRFIGDASARIREDVLRILRFFRFYACFGRGEADGTALTACRELAGLMPQLSAERVWREVKKLLLAVDPVPAWRLMLAQGVLAAFLAEAVQVERLARLVAAEQALAAPEAERRLASLLREPGAARDVALRLRLANREAALLVGLAHLPGTLDGKTDPVPLRRVLHAKGAELVRGALLLRVADGDGFDARAALAVVEDWDAPEFPVRGEDIVKLGVPPGPRVGEVLRAVEDWWIAEDFRASREACLTTARRVVGA